MVEVLKAGLESLFERHPLPWSVIRVNDVDLIMDGSKVIVVECKIRHDKTMHHSDLESLMKLMNSFSPVLGTSRHAVPAKVEQFWANFPTEFLG